MEKKLCCVEEGKNCQIISISGQNKCRLLELGFIRGAEIKILRKSNYNGPIEIQLLHSKIAIRNEEASNILVTVK